MDLSRTRHRHLRVLQPRDQAVVVKRDRNLCHCWQQLRCFRFLLQLVLQKRTRRGCREQMRLETIDYTWRNEEERNEVGIRKEDLGPKVVLFYISPKKKDLSRPWYVEPTSHRNWSSFVSTTAFLKIYSPPWIAVSAVPHLVLPGVTFFFLCLFSASCLNICSVQACYVTWKI